ncbi:cytochrome P450 CYP82D47-like [Syzygium oleosum]|uniref:cytochrome P450 CYP82D47-like n=1 Tax=Syzygium oleosum TaxID=219896 RepID=UPI0011D17D37|nr:cytochrome P450 CYP82D47-like [Syzygium oleosum]
MYQSPPSSYPIHVYISPQPFSSFTNMESSFSFPAAALAGTVFAFAIFFYCFASLLIRTQNNRGSIDGRKEASLPEAGGAWPLIGHLHLLGGPVPPHIVLANMADKYGPIFTVKMGIYRALIVSNWEIAKQCLTVNDRVFATRPKSVSSEVMAYNYAMFGLAPYGPYWRHVRKIAILDLLSNHRLELLKHLRESEVQASINHIYKRCVENYSGAPKKVLVDMKRWFGDITLNVVFRMIVGKRYEDERDEKGRQAFRDFFDLAGRFVVSDAFPVLRWLDLDGYEKMMKKTAQELDRVVQGWLNEHKSRRNTKKGHGSNKDNDQDFMDVLLSSVYATEELPDYDADTFIKATCMALVLAGSDTTTVSLTWALSLLLNHREVLKKAQHELDTHIGREKPVKESDLKNLVYIQAIIKETLRLYPAGPLGVPHESMDDCTVDGYHVPRGTRLLFNLWKIHRDPRIWSDPLEFRPERFLTTHKDFDIRGQNFELIPFGSGRRMCPGINLAMQMMSLSLAALLQGFDITTSADEPVDMAEAIGMTNLKATPLEVLATPRLPEHAYQ